MNFGLIFSLLLCASSLSYVHADALALSAPAPSKAEILSEHLVEATFSGIIDRPCMFRTALCPDRCGHAKKIASFQTIKYLEYKLVGKYGDEKQEVFMLDMDPAHKPQFQSAEIIAEISKLKPGDKVRLHWVHYYMHDDKGSYPERPVLSIIPIEESKSSEPSLTK